MTDYFDGSEWSRSNGKKALPILIDLAASRRTVTYKELAVILFGDPKYAHPLMVALGRLGDALNLLGKQNKKLGNIPPIQLLVCNQVTRRPGNLALNFLGLSKRQTDAMSENALDSLVLATHQAIFAYDNWGGVLMALGMNPATLKLPSSEQVLSNIKDMEAKLKGEGEDHRRLKLFISQNPGAIGISANSIGNTEALLLSGDRLDVSFRDDGRWIAVEVKGQQSPVADIVRGIFQCLKYRVIMAAQLRYVAFVSGNRGARTSPEVVLACGGSLSEKLRKLAKALNVPVKYGILVPKDFEC